MDQDHRAGLCGERAGFLFKHACDQLALHPCAACGKGVCQAHTHETGRGEVCTSCARSEVKPEEARSHSRFRHDPFFYGYGMYHTYGYLHHDRSDFTEADGQALTGGEEPWERDMGES